MDGQVGVPRGGVGHSMPQGQGRARRASRRGTAPAPRQRGGRSWAWIVGLAVLVMAGAGGWWLLRPHALPAGPMIGEHVPDEGYDHVPVGSAIPYRAHPPASGPHYPMPAPAGVYMQGLAPGFWVHNLEHGYIVVLFRPPAAPGVELRLQEMLRDFPPSKFGNVKFVAAPYEDMPHQYAVLSWDWRLWLHELDRAKVLEFYRAHVDQGREDLP